MRSKAVNLDILAFGAHPDDVEACAGGTIAKSAKEGLTTGIVDLTSGDNSDFAGGQLRIKESQKAAKALGVKIRENLQLPERRLQPTSQNENEIIKIIRKYSPSIVILPHWYDRHRGHRDASRLIERAVQSAKYQKILPDFPPHKVKKILFYMIHYEFEPNFIFDISETHDQKMKALFCHKSQFFKRDKNGKYTKELIDKDFMEAWIARSRWYGYIAGVRYGEPFTMRRPTGIRSLTSLTNLYR